MLLQEELASGVAEEVGAPLIIKFFRYPLVSLKFF